MRQSAVSFQADSLNIEGIVAQPDNNEGDRPGVVICHPGPMNGGNMDNNVVMAVAGALVERGFAVLRFNFRGVGNSQGEHGRGEVEYQDALAALEFLKGWSGVQHGKLGLAGYSFGTGVILRSPELHKEPMAFGFVSPSLQSLQNSPLKTDDRPKFIITGDRDRLAPSPEFHPTLDSFTHSPSCQVIEGADHFWVGREAEMSNLVGDFFAKHLN